MADWINLIVLSACAVITLSSPHPDGAYNIPRVGTGRQSQYFVLHRDGTHKYGHDTGEGAFESAKSHRVGQQNGEFGYVGPDGSSVNLQYTAGEGGFVASGSHLPQPHPDFHAAHAAARLRPPFFDPLANPNADASYGFQFAGEGQTRSEHSDASGNVRGSYSYTDEDGITRTYSYTAGPGTGFVVEGNDLPLSPQTPESSGSTPAATRQSSSSNRYSSSSRISGLLGSSASSSSSSLTSQLSSFNGNAIASSYNVPSASLQGSASTTFPTQLPSPSSGSQVFSSGSPSFSTRPNFEEANTRSERRQDGSYNFAYETSGHSRNEAGNRNNNVDGNFAFVADDGQRRQIQYQASSGTGFIAEGSHIPVGPIVPGAPSGQPTGRITPVQEVPFFDPLANSNADASYNFAFNSDQYSRSESADADGNVRGTYTITDDDGTRRTIRFRAGEGIGFQTEQVSSSGGPTLSRPSPSSAAPQRGTFNSAASISAGGFAASASTQAVAYSSPSSSSRGVKRPSSSRGATRASSSSASTYSSSSSSSSSSSRHSASSLQSHNAENFKLTQYDASTNPNKFGYVITYN